MHAKSCCRIGEEPVLVLLWCSWVVPGQRQCCVRVGVALAVLVQAQPTCRCIEILPEREILRRSVSALPHLWFCKHPENANTQRSHLENSKSKVAPWRKIKKTKNILGQEPPSVLLDCQCSAGAVLSVLNKHVNVSMQSQNGFSLIVQVQILEKELDCTVTMWFLLDKLILGGKPD